MEIVRRNAYAKLNFTLDVLGVREGYHEIDSLAATIGLSDRIVVRKRRDGIIRVTMRGGGEEIPPEKNNAYLAGAAFMQAFQTRGADITIYKNIPIGAGLGGSSADAAGVLRALSDLYSVGNGEELKEIADSLGSDTGYLLKGGFARLRGRGEKVEYLPALPPFFALILIPRGISTAECFRLCGGEVSPPRTERALSLLRSGNFECAAKLFSNGLFSAAKKIEPDVEKAYFELKEFSPLAVNMTGSGSGVYALFSDFALCEWAKSRYRGRFSALCVKSQEAF